MRVAVIVAEFPLLSETFILNQITGLIDRGHDVDIYAQPPREAGTVHPDVERYGLLKRTHYQPTFARARLIRSMKGLGLLAKYGWGNPRLTLRALNVLRYGKHAASLNLLYALGPFLAEPAYDIVHCHFGPVGLRGSLLRDAGAVHGRLVTTFYGYDVTKYPRIRGPGVYRPLFRADGLVLVLSEHMKAQLIDLGCSADRVMVHHLGIDCQRFSLAPRRPSDDDALRVLTIARMVEKKGLEFAVRAVAKVAAAGRRVRYTIVGHGPLFERLQGLIGQLGLGGCVELLGWKDQQEVAALLGETDIVLLPSVTARDGDEEGTPTVLMEAMARGLPVVSTLHSGIPEVVQDDVSGFLVPERNVDALTDRLRYLLEHPKRWPEMGRAGRRAVEEHFNIDKLNDRLVGIYEQLIAGESCSGRCDPRAPKTRTAE